MTQVNLLRALPKTSRNIAARRGTKDDVAITVAKQFGQSYFDGARRYGYGGYSYDGRWQPVARDIIDHYALAAGTSATVLDVGCAKGFLVKDLVDLGVNAYGLDISDYALKCADPVVAGRLVFGNADRLPYADKVFDLALSINTLHNLKRDRLVIALRELTRVSRRQFIQVDSYETPEQKAAFEDWVLTAEYHNYPTGWLKLFEEADYTGDYDWTIVQ